ncbi:MAG: hypothetical protein WC707_06740 [Candidatus Babeliaceae bacterium]|jgi:hypothetical protein
MNGQYILKGKTPVECNDLMEWAKQMEGKNRIVEQSQFEDVKVSTVFLGLDHSFGDGEPLLFETMIFGGEHDQYQDRYSTWDEAVEGHKKACELVSLV